MLANTHTYGIHSYPNQYHYSNTLNATAKNCQKLYKPQHAAELNMYSKKPETILDSTK